MKNISKVLFLSGIALVSLGGVCASLLPLTSCGEPGVPKAPNHFVWSNDITTNTWWKTMQPFYDNWKITKTNIDWATDMANPSFYSDNLIKWDIITQYCIVAAPQLGWDGTGDFILFERDGINVKYQLSLWNLAHTTQLIVYSTAVIPTGTNDVTPQFTPMQFSWSNESYLGYKINATMTPTYAFSDYYLYAVSAFMNNTQVPTPI